MTIRSTGLLALLVATATAFRNTSPFFLLSTSDIFESHPPPSRLVSASSANTRISEVIGKCSSTSYFVVQQPGVSASDFTSRRYAPYVWQWLNSTAERTLSTWIVPELVGELDADAISQEIQDKCKAAVVTVDVSTGTIQDENISPRVMHITFNPLPSHNPTERLFQLSENDAFLDTAVRIFGNDDYTLFFATTPLTNPHVPKPPAYEMDSKYEAAIHEDLKRDLTAHTADDTSNSSPPLFERYQFFSPGIFMGLFISILLLSILYVGINAVSSLEVSYFAFSKEMGPAAQKKQQ